MPGVRFARAFEQLRKFRILTYFAIMTGGLLGLVDPPSVLTSNSSEQTARVLAVFWLVGGLTCAFTVTRRRLSGELVFLPMLAWSFWIFAGVLIVQAHHLGDLRIAVYGTVMIGFGAMLYAFHGVVKVLAEFGQEGLE